MNLNFLKIFARNLKKNKLISAINILGLTIGLLSSLFIFEYVFFERSFDSYHKNGSRVCRVAYNHYQYGKLQWKVANSFYPTGRWLKENYSEVQDWAVNRLRKEVVQYMFNGDTENTQYLIVSPPD